MSESLFASDYSLSPTSPTTPTSFRGLSPRPSASPIPSRSSPLRSNSTYESPLDAEIAAKQSSAPPLSPSQVLGEGRKSLEVVFPTPNIYPTPPASPARVESTSSHAPSLASSTRTSKTDSEIIDVDPLDRPVVIERKKSGHGGYTTYEGCLEGGIGHEVKSGSYQPGTEKAYHHLTRAHELFGLCLTFRASDPRAMLARSKVLIQLASTYQPPRAATVSLKNAVSLLRDLMRIAPNSVSAKETFAQACALLSSTLLDTVEENVDDEVKVWEGNVGELAREALAVLEDVAATKMDRMRAMKQEQATEHAPSMAETFLSLASAALTVSNLATDLANVEMHCELAEQALDQASNMATIAATARIKSSTSSANLITRVQIASGKSSIERLRHIFILGTELDEDDFRSLLSDVKLLATETRERATKLKGSKAASAHTLAWEATKQLGDAKLVYASLLRLVWRRRKPMRVARSVDGNRKLSSRSDQSEPTIQEEEAEDESPSPLKPHTSSLDEQKRSLSKRASIALLETLRKDSFDSTRRGSTAKSEDSFSLRSSDGAKAVTPRKASNLDAIIEDVSHSAKQPTSPLRKASTTMTLSPPPARRGSWLPTIPGDSLSRNRRASSMSAPLVGPDGISAWNRKASVICLSADEEAQKLVPSSQLAKTAWDLLESAVKQYKTALSLLSSSDLPPAHLARARTETLYAIAYCSLFMASLGSRLSPAKEKKTSLLVTAEIYSTWAAREVGWSFLIEGTKEAKMADRRTNSWRADEGGKKAVMLLVRVWWYRAVTTETIDVETKINAKDAVETVVKRMKDKEGVKEADVARFRAWIAKIEGDMDPAEMLFWRSVVRILRGGSGFVMG